MQHDVMGAHGMLVLGRADRIYLLHLAMRGHAAHQFQVILRVDLEADAATAIGDRRFVGDDVELGNTSANDVYFQDRGHVANNVAVYTFRPGEQFPLAEIVDGRRTAFRGDFVRGHFERQPSAPDILSNVTVQVRRILYAQHLQAPGPDEGHPLDAGVLEYLLFGAGEEYFMSHRITLHGQKSTARDNAFHQVFELKQPSTERLRFELTRAAVLAEVDASHATSEGRLPVEGGKITGQLKGLIRDVDASLPLRIEVHPEHYLEILM